MPDDIAIEKVNAMKCLGATVERVRPASIVDTKHVRPLCIVPLVQECTALDRMTLFISVCGKTPVRGCGRNLFKQPRTAEHRTPICCKL